MYFDDDLRKLRANKKSLKEEIDAMNDEEQIEIEEAKKEIEQKYENIKQQRWNEFNELNAKIRNECELIQIASTFNLNDVTEIIAKLISVYENEEYIIKTLTYKLSNKDLNNDAKVIVNKANLRIFDKEIKETQFNHMAKNGIIIPFIKGFSENNFAKQVCFYEANETNLNQRITFRKHVYAKEFIDFVITYRVKKNITQISLKQLEELLAKFVYYNFEQIKKYHEFKDERKRRELEAYIEKEKQERAIFIKRMLEKYNLEQ